MRHLFGPVYRRRLRSHEFAPGSGKLNSKISRYTSSAAALDNDKSIADGMAVGVFYSSGWAFAAGGICDALWGGCGGVLQQWVGFCGRGDLFWALSCSMGGACDIRELQ